MPTCRGGCSAEIELDWGFRRTITAVLHRHHLVIVPDDALMENFAGLVQFLPFREATVCSWRLVTGFSAHSLRNFHVANEGLECTTTAVVGYQKAALYISGRCVFFGGGFVGNQRLNGFKMAEKYRIL